MTSMTETLTIRPSTPADMAALDAMFARSYPKLLKADYPPSVLVLALPIISRAQPALVRSGTFYVAETEDGGIVGAGGWTPRSQAGLADVRHVVTDYRHTRRGVGRAIFTRIFKDARAAGVRQMECSATRTAVPFYQAMGFVTLQPVEVGLRPGISFPAILMRRRL
ncbi:MAG: GNAT family N-acetyltransferase [Rhodobacter sp.]|nr:GNAT family N-acetyltransferase [Rhodobacter sp.]